MPNTDTEELTERASRLLNQQKTKHPHSLISINLSIVIGGLLIKQKKC